MAYGKDDPRSALATAAKPDSGEPVAAAQCFEFGDLASPDGETVKDRTAVVRGQNIIIAYTWARTDDELDNGTLDGEAAVLLLDDSPAISAVVGGETTRIDGPGFLVIPPGASRLQVHGDGPVLRLIEATEADWQGVPANADAYAEDHPRVALLERWPEPVGGYKLRYYPLADVPDDKGRFGRIFRTRSFMVNFIYPQHSPRDPHKMSPHTHDDFEQLSLAVQGSYVHHIRTPWQPDSTLWREDEHIHVGSPSVCIIPPPTVHTSAASDPVVNQLLDIFSPPRTDFSAKPGWVLNADEYPAP